MAKSKLKVTDPALLSDLGTLLPKTGYIRIDDPGNLPDTLRGYVPPGFKTMVIAASTYTGQPTNAPCQYAPSATVYLLRTYRDCEHNGNPHFNVDDHAFWKDRQGHKWEASYKEAPDHYQEAVAGTTVSDLWNLYAIPVASSGNLEDFRKGGGRLNFVEVCPGLATRKDQQDSS